MSRLSRHHQLLGVASNVELGAGLFHLVLAHAEAEVQVPAFAAGQFAQLAVPGLTLPRPFSILRCTPQHLEFLVRQVGPGSQWLCQRQVGDRVPVLWPLGSSFSQLLPPEALEEELLLVGGGVGIAPLIAFKEQWPGPCRLLFGHRTAQDARVNALLAPDLEVDISTEDGSLGFHGRVTGLLTQVLGQPGRRPRRVLSCGPEAMMDAVATLAAAHGVPCSLSLETMMGCGIGICVGCAVPLANGRVALACQEGPVFQADQVAAFGHPQPACTCGGPA